MDATPEDKRSFVDFLVQQGFYYQVEQELQDSTQSSQRSSLLYQALQNCCSQHLRASTSLDINARNLYTILHHHIHADIAYGYLKKTGEQRTDYEEQLAISKERVRRAGQALVEQVMKHVRRRYDQGHLWAAFEGSHAAQNIAFETGAQLCDEDKNWAMRLAHEALDAGKYNLENARKEPGMLY
ncbi:hypothetical protein GF342_04920 [Candidatus Woesearchaeota archaeon]|nr:hypothetical protein [Candidatus Woesearchaeota archaeon]